MKHMMAIFPFLAAFAGAQEDVYKTLATGDRIQITFRTGGTLIGTLVPPSVLGAAASQRPKGRAMDLRMSRAPFSIHLFTKKADPSGDTQILIVDAWKKSHPEATLTRMPMEDAASADLIKQLKILATPALLLGETGSGRNQVLVGLHSAERLEAALGRLRARAEDEKVDYTREAALTLDVTWEYPGLNGAMAVSKKDVREIRKLQKLDEQTRRRLEEERLKIKEVQDAEEIARREGEDKKNSSTASEIDKADQEAKDAELKANEQKALQDKVEKLKTADDLLKQFPTEQWTEERRQEILNKTQTRLPVSPEERLFLEKNKDWADAVKAAKEKKEKQEKEKTPEEGAVEKKP